MNPKLISSLAISAASYLMQNKQARQKLMDQFQSMKKSKKNGSAESSLSDRKITSTNSAISKNKMLGSLAIGAATYIMTNKKARDKVLGQFQSMTKGKSNGVPISSHR
ncbi:MULTISPECIES: hypothetical protein [unclassified Bacillus (in: firmicutes)]|uniref:hypothetical protein n=1 Tax=unclassified Bacillus (in: firmicutes) TaxID=185979 RepID=UPI0008EACFE5|nr:MULTISPECIES: hypothetical protein [unclassified Bacillus (in: firmicutes)]SFB14053.1 hypothetical protein SAMN02799634_106265 [Bacillus sp. UNCCL13]SFQ89821.1 hypothetical protein SAMN04488577_3554 [Bacillus sp. cl95]